MLDSEEQEKSDAAGGEGELGERKQCGMHGLHIDAIGQAKKDAL